jgi:GNAT superfamily N-acetyltransferase
VTGRRARPLTGELLEHFPSPCRTCLFWERGEAPPASVDPTRVGSPTSQDEMALVRKQAWVSTRLQEGHAPGRAVEVEGMLAGWVLFAPREAFAPRPPPAPRLSEDALQLATLYVHPQMRGHGLGRLLLHAALREAVRLERGAVEAYGDRRWRDRGCLLPATWLLREGFEVHRESPRLPLLRLEVRRTLRWAPSLEAALEEVLRRLPRPVPAPEQLARAVPPEEPAELR